MMKEYAIFFWGKIKNFQFPTTIVLLLICIHLFLCFFYVLKKKSKTQYLNVLCKNFFFIFSSFIIYLVLFQTKSQYLTNFLDKINIIATITLTIIALKISIEQNRIANFDFSEKIGFPALTHYYELNKTDINDIEQYTLYKQSFITPTDSDTEIYDFVFYLDKPLNPQILYELNSVRIYDFRVLPQNLKNEKHMQGDYFEQVSFETNSLGKSTIRIIIDDTKKHFLPVLNNPNLFSNKNCNELSVVFDFSITDLVNNAFYNKELYLIVRFTKCNSKPIHYEMSSVQTFVYK